MDAGDEGWLGSNYMLKRTNLFRLAYLLNLILRKYKIMLSKYWVLR
jgi:hypothetical protein